MLHAGRTAQPAVVTKLIKPEDLPFSRITDSEDGTRELAATFAQLVRPGDLILLLGELGAGKTCFVRGLCAGLGMTELWEVDSPTYTVVNHYPIGPGLDHIDLYRFSDLAELEEIGFTEMLDSNSIIAVEWPERLAGYPLAQAAWLIRFQRTGAAQRRITIEKLLTE